VFSEAFALKASLMKEINRQIIPIKSGYQARALCWHGDELVDWAGIIRYQLDGTSSGPNIMNQSLFLIVIIRIGFDRQVRNRTASLA